MLKLIVGLGNPGRQYQRTRHNAGFWFVDRVVASFGARWSREARFQGLLANINLHGQQVFFLKPETFMNRSGQSVGLLVRYYKIKVEEILVVHDELDFEPGVIKLKKGGGHAGHNGLRDIAAHLGNNDFYRLRIGIGRPPGRMKVSDYVLSEPGKVDCQEIINCFEPVFANLDMLISGKFEKFMNSIHA
jgi:peptidyl-tRNA hydrolase, PTH1 family